MSQTYEAQAIQQSEKSSSPKAASHILGKFGLVVLLVILLLSAWYGQVVIVVLLGLAISAAGLARLWSRLSLVGVHCQRFLSGHRIFPGESIELKLRLVNRKLLPLPWVQVDTEIPDRLTSADAASLPESRSGFRLLSHNASLLWYTAVNWRCHLDCRKRGYYPLGPMAITSGDIFGLYPRSTAQLSTDHIIVYPKIFAIEQLGLPSLNPLGETQAERRIFEDQTRTIGVRDYSPHDSLRYVHWKASARHQNLQVKVFEPTTTLKMAIFLAVDSFPDVEEADDDFELGVSTAASIANYIVQQRSQVGLFVNSRLPDSRQQIRIPSGGGLHQLINILEALAKVVPVPGSSFEEFFQEEWGNLPWGTTLILIISRPPEGLPALLLSLKESGYKSVVIQINAPDKTGAEHAAVWHSIGSAEELAKSASGVFG
ncbi:DUF58 domain-containing protein [Chloroflexota bacterium]